MLGRIGFEADELQVRARSPPVGLQAAARADIDQRERRPFEVLPGEIQLGWGGTPGVRLLLAIAGSLALCVTAGLISTSPLTKWLRWLGERSIVVYLVFVLPMSFARIGLAKLGLAHDVTLSSFLVMVIAIGASVGLYLLVQWTGRGKFLFERPAWAHLRGTKGSRSYPSQPAVVPAE